MMLRRVRAKLLQACLTLSYPGDHGPQDSSVHGILQGRILEWVAMFFSRGSQFRDQTCISRIAGGWILYRLSHQGSPEMEAKNLSSLLCSRNAMRHTGSLYERALRSMLERHHRLTKQLCMSTGSEDTS